jgi:hypothetical protein
MDKLTTIKLILDILTTTILTTKYTIAFTRFLYPRTKELLFWTIKLCLIIFEFSKKLFLYFQKNYFYINNCIQEAMY